MKFNRKDSNQGKVLVRGAWYMAKVLDDEFGLRVLLYDSEGAALTRIVSHEMAKELLGTVKLIADRLSCKEGWE